MQYVVLLDAPSKPAWSCLTSPALSNKPWQQPAMLNPAQQLWGIIYSGLCSAWSLYELSSPSHPPFTRCRWNVATHCCRRCPGCHSLPRSRRWPSTGRRWSLGWGSSCRRSSWLPSGHRCRCHSRCPRWQSSSRAEQTWGLPAYPAIQWRGWKKMLGGRNHDKNTTVAFISSPTVPTLTIFNLFNCLALF